MGNTARSLSLQNYVEEQLIPAWNQIVIICATET